jgi:hypothetical protein
MIDLSLSNPGPYVRRRVNEPSRLETLIESNLSLSYRRVLDSTILEHVEER